MLKAEAVVLDTDRADAAFAKIAAARRGEHRCRARRRPAGPCGGLASTLGLRPPGDPLGSLDPRELYRELVAAWRALLASLGARPSSPSSRTSTGPTRRCSTCSTSSPSGSRGRFSSSAPRVPTYTARDPTGVGARSFSSLPLDPLARGRARGWCPSCSTSTRSRTTCISASSSARRAIRSSSRRSSAT